MRRILPFWNKGSILLFLLFEREEYKMKEIIEKENINIEDMIY